MSNYSAVVAIYILFFVIFEHLSKASIMEPVVVNRKPCKCPKCGGKVVKIVYGEPCPELFEQAERKEVVLGGCCINLDGNGRIQSRQTDCLHI